MSTVELEPKFPGQVPILYFDLPQLEALASPIRSEVFWSFSWEEPRSAADIARALGKSAQTVHYHVNGLLAVGLLLEVDRRRRGARFEKLYVHAAAKLFVQQTPPSEQHGPITKGFKGLTRMMAREFEAMWEAIDVDPSFQPTGLNRKIAMRLRPEHVAELKRRVLELTDELMDTPSDDEGPHIHMYVFVTPTLGVSQDWIEKKSRSRKRTTKRSRIDHNHQQ